MLNVAAQENFNQFIGLDVVKNQLRTIRKLLGLSKGNSLKTFANSAAAVTGGLKSGDFYVTSTGVVMRVL